MPDFAYRCAKLPFCPLFWFSAYFTPEDNYTSILHGVVMWSLFRMIKTTTLVREEQLSISFFPSYPGLLLPLNCEPVQLSNCTEVLPYHSPTCITALRPSHSTTTTSSLRYLNGIRIISSKIPRFYGRDKGTVSDVRFCGQCGPSSGCGVESVRISGVYNGIVE